MQNPFQILGLTGMADEQQVRDAYRRLVKSCHPDAVMDEALKVNAQERLIELNLAYEEALKRVCRPSEGAHRASPQEVLRLAQRLLKQKMPESALRALDQSAYREAVWYYLYGVGLMQQHQPERAHTFFRTAVRMQPDQKSFRMAAIKACTAQKKQEQGLPARLARLGKQWFRKQDE